MADTRHPNPTSGSETRRRCHQVGVRLLPEEWAKLTAHAERAGEFPGTVLRRAYFPEPSADEPTEREVEALARVEAYLVAMTSLKATEHPGEGEWPDNFSIDTCLRHDVEEYVNTELHESDLRVVTALARAALRGDA